MARPRAASRRGGAGESVRIDAREFTELYTRMKAADKVIAKRMRKTLKSAADDAVKAVRDAALEAPPAKVGSLTHGIKRTRRKDGTFRIQRVINGYNARQGGRTRTRGMRAALAKATSASLTKTNLTVRTSQRKVPEGMGPMVKAWNSRMFRHPVFADAVNDLRDSRTRGFRALTALRRSQGRKGPGSWKWVYQGGTTYFTRGRDESLGDLRKALSVAMEKAAQELAD